MAKTVRRIKSPEQIRAEDILWWAQIAKEGGTIALFLCIVALLCWLKA